MLKILLCDDEKTITDTIHPIIYDFCKQKNQEFTIEVLNDGNQAMEVIQNNQYDVLFLDIELGEMSGLDLAKEARLKNSQAQIVFISNYIEYQKYVFSIHTFDYIMKPFTYEDIINVLEDLLNWLKEKQGIKKHYELFKTKDAVINLNIDQIIYFEYKDRKVSIVMEDKSYIVNMKISDILKRMEVYNFFMPHKAFVMNMLHIDKFYFQQGTITMSNGDILPLSQLKSREFKERYLKINSIDNKGGRK